MCALGAGPTIRGTYTAPRKRNPHGHDSYTIILGNNEVTNCAAALVIEGEEVFRLREDEQGALLIDCDFRDQHGTRIAKIARNYVAHVAPGFEARMRPGEPADVIEHASGQLVGRIERLGPRRIKVAGCFCVDGYWVLARDEGVFLAGGTVISDNSFHGWGTAINLKRGSLGLGCVP